MKDADAAVKFCAGGGTVVLTDTAGVAAFRAARGARLCRPRDRSRDEASDRRHRALAPGTSAAAVKACQPETAVSTFLPAGGGLPNGIYRAEYTDEYLKKWGLGVSDVKFNHGVWTYTLEDGHWAIDQLADDATSRIEGAYRVAGRDLFWRWDSDPGQPVEHLTWEIDRRGDLILAPAPGTTEFWTFAIPLARVGDIPHRH